MQEPTTKNEGSDNMDFAAEFRSVLGLDDLFNTTASADFNNDESSSADVNSSDNVVDSDNSHGDPEIGSDTEESSATHDEAPANDVQSELDSRSRIRKSP